MKKERTILKNLSPSARLKLHKFHRNEKMFNFRENKDDGLDNANLNCFLGSEEDAKQLE